MQTYQRPTETNELLRSFNTRKEARDFSNGVNMGLSIGGSDSYAIVAAYYESGDSKFHVVLFSPRV